MNIVTYQVSGLSCNACVNRVKNALLPYAEHVEVTLKPPRAVLQNPKLSTELLNAALTPPGHYQLTEIPQQAENKNTSYWLKWFLVSIALFLVIKFVGNYLFFLIKN